MDGNNVQIQSQGSICSDSNGDDTYKNDSSGMADRRICLVGNVAKDPKLRSAAESFGVPVVLSKNGDEYVNDPSCCTYFVIDDFEGDHFERLWSKARQTLLGPPALYHLARQEKKELPDNTRPLFSTTMKGVVVCLTGFREKDALKRAVPIIHHMGGSIRKDLSSKVTHLIANRCGGEKYQYANTFKVPIVGVQWALESWDHRCDLDFDASEEEFVSKHRLKPFHGAKVCFLGFAQEEEHHMEEVLVQNGGTVTTLYDPECTHVVVDESAVTDRPDVPSRVQVVKAEWFWTSVQKESALEEKDYLFEDYIDTLASPAARRESHVGTPNSASRRKRKRVHESFLQSLADQNPTPALHKRRSSVSDAGLLSVSGSFLDCTASPGEKKAIEEEDTQLDNVRKALTTRHQVFLELLQTELNYVGILRTIITLFKNHLEDMPEEEALLNNPELNLIFGKLPPIYETHVEMLEEFRKTANNWSEDRSIGDIIIKFSTQLQRAYPPFINYFEEMKEVLTRCDQTKPRFHAFLKAMQTKPECGRQSLQELMIRPVQRLGSISLLLNDLLKNTPKTNKDHSALDQALAALREVMTHINEDKRKAEGQVTLFNIFNDIDNCPPDIVSSHRSYITRADVIQLSSSEGLANKGSNLALFLFTDQLVVCKKKSKSFNSTKSPSASSFQMQTRPIIKPYKHVKMMALNTIKRVIDIKETEDCHRVFSMVCRGNDEIRERLYSFAMADEEGDKATFLKTLTRTMANNVCSADADKFMAYLEPQQLNIDTTDLTNGTLSKALKFAKTRLKVGRTFSFNRSTPSKLKRAVSSMMSPFGSSTNLTPASQLANMRLASYSNINELGSHAETSDESHPVAPMSVQPTRKMKASSLGVNALKRL